MKHLCHQVWKLCRARSRNAAVPMREDMLFFLISYASAFIILYGFVI